MRRAIAVAKDTNTEISLIDRNVKITLRRAWAKASLWALMKISCSLIWSMFSSKKISEEEIEKLKDQDALTQ